MIERRTAQMARTRSLMFVSVLKNTGFKQSNESYPDFVGDPDCSGSVGALEEMLVSSSGRSIQYMYILSEKDSSFSHHQ